MLGEYEDLLDEARIASVPSNEAGDEWKIAYLWHAFIEAVVNNGDHFHPNTFSIDNDAGSNIHNVEMLTSTGTHMDTETGFRVYK